MKRQSIIRILVLPLFLLFLNCGEGDSSTGTATSNIKIVNNTAATTMVSMYISLSSSISWGANQFGTVTLAPGESFLLSNIPVGTYEIMVSTASTSALAADKSAGFHSWRATKQLVVEHITTTFSLTDTNNSFSFAPADDSVTVSDSVSSSFKAEYVAQ